MTEQWCYVTGTWSNNDVTSRFTYLRANLPSQPRFLFIMAVTWIGCICYKVTYRCASDTCSSVSVALLACIGLMSVTRKKPNCGTKALHNWGLQQLTGATGYILQTLNIALPLHTRRLEWVVMSMSWLRKHCHWPKSMSTMSSTISEQQITLFFRRIPP